MRAKRWPFSELKSISVDQGQLSWKVNGAMQRDRWRIERARKREAHGQQSADVVLGLQHAQLPL